MVWVLWQFTSWRYPWNWTTTVSPLDSWSDSWTVLGKTDQQSTQHNESGGKKSKTCSVMIDIFFDFFVEKDQWMLCLPWHRGLRRTVLKSNETEFFIWAHMLWRSVDVPCQNRQSFANIDCHGSFLEQLQGDGPLSKGKGRNIQVKDL